MNLKDKKELAFYKNKQILQHNTLTSGRYEFSACQLDILFMVLALLKKGEKKYVIYVSDIEAITGRKWNYKQLRTSTATIGSRKIEIERTNSFSQIWIFQKVEYMYDKGCFEVNLSEDILPYFFELKNNFTILHLASVLTCPSKYAKRIYTICCQWKNVYKKTFEIVELKKALGLINHKGKEKFTTITGLKTRVLNVAKEQINKYTDIHFDYELVKRGRSFKYINFFINYGEFKNALQTQIDFNEDTEVQKFRNYLANLKFNKQHIEQLVQKITYQEFIERVNNLKRDPKAEAVKNIVAYMTSIYKNEGVILED